MRPSNEPLQIPAGEFASYLTDGRHPDELFEIYNNTAGPERNGRNIFQTGWISWHEYH